jgi:hypothetical protein
VQCSVFFAISYLMQWCVFCASFCLFSCLYSKPVFICSAVCFVQVLIICSDLFSVSLSVISSGLYSDLVPIVCMVCTLCQFLLSEVACILTQFLFHSPYCVSVLIVSIDLYSVQVLILTSYFTEFHIVLFCYPVWKCIYICHTVISLLYRGVLSVCCVVSKFMTSVQVYMQSIWQYILSLGVN